MTINKDNVTDYQISHIGSTQEDRLEVCRILESLGQKVGATSFKNESIEYIFKDDVFYLGLYSYSLRSPIPSKITVTSKEFIQMTTPITITKDNIRDYAIQRVESKSLREQVILALQKLGEKTIDVNKTMFTEDRKVQDDYFFRFNGSKWETRDGMGPKKPLKPSEFLKAVAHLLLSTNPRDYVIDTSNTTEDKLKILKIDEMLSEISGVDLSSGRLTLDNNSIKTLISVGELSSRTELIKTKGKPMPKTLKDNAVELVQENKAAAFTAAEIKAGQIINQQAISLIKPKLPMMIRGYADSPLASVVLANVVALGLKQYAAGNSKLEKISELMIAGAAFDSIDALNLDGLVNDFIAGIKLPAGVEIE